MWAQLHGQLPLDEVSAQHGQRFEAPELLEDLTGADPKNPPPGGLASPEEPPLGPLLLGVSWGAAGLLDPKKLS